MNSSQEHGYNQAEWIRESGGADLAWMLKEAYFSLGKIEIIASSSVGINGQIEDDRAALEKLISEVERTVGHSARSSEAKEFYDTGRKWLPITA